MHINVQSHYSFVGRDTCSFIYCTILLINIPEDLNVLVNLNKIDLVILVLLLADRQDIYQYLLSKTHLQKTTEHFSKLNMALWPWISKHYPVLSSDLVHTSAGSVRGDGGSFPGAPSGFYPGGWISWMLHPVTWGAAVSSQMSLQPHEERPMITFSLTELCTL
jgi:hypothetical protein